MIEPSYLTGAAIFSGSVVAGLTSLMSNWLTKKHERRIHLASENKLWRQKLYAQFTEEASTLYVDALIHEEADAARMVSIYAVVSKIRMTSSPQVVESAEAVIRTILATYSRPNKTFPELQDLMLNKAFVDPLLTFSRICRDELEDDFKQHRRYARPAKTRDATSSGRMAALLTWKNAP